MINDGVDYNVRSLEQSPPTIEHLSLTTNSHLITIVIIDRSRHKSTTIRRWNLVRIERVLPSAKEPGM
jgi:hypothetical protein